MIVTGLFVLVLAAAWLVLFIPSLRGVRTISPTAGTRPFQRRLQAVAPPPRSGSGRWVIVPEGGPTNRFHRSQRRRRQVLIGVLAGLSVAVALALLGVIEWWVTAGVAAIASLDIAFLLEAKRRRLLRRNVTRMRPRSGARGRAVVRRA